MSIRIGLMLRVRVTRSRRLVSCALVLVLGMSLMGCSVKEKLDTMHDATTEMNHQTKHLGKATDELNDKTWELYDDLRQSDSLASRRASLQALNSADDAPHRISEAAKYFMGFEYQIWSDLGKDTLKRREELAASAAREFMRDVQEFTHGVTAPSPLAIYDSKAHALNALSGAMHVLSHKQEVMLKQCTDLKPISMLSMIQEALVVKKEITSGEKKLEDMAPYVPEILAYESVAVLVLQTRYNFLGAMALARISKIRDGIFEYGKARFWSWELDLSDKNVIEVREFTRYLTGAMKVHAFLLSVGVQPLLDPSLAMAFKNMKLSPTLSAQVEQFHTSSTPTSAKDAAVVELVDAIEVYRSSGQSAAP